MIDYANFIFQIKTMPNKVLTVSDFESFFIIVSLKKSTKVFNFTFKFCLLDARLN